MSVSFVILAAGQGTRLKSDLPKVLHQVAHAPLLAHAMRSADSLEPTSVVVVTGHEGAQVADVARDLNPDVLIVEQTERLGTGHAVAQAKSALADTAGDVIVLYGDTPFIKPDTLSAMQAARAAHDVVVLGFRPADAGRYGRLITTGDTLDRIVEFKDANDEERTVSLCNSGVISASREILFDLISRIENDNASGEYYLTDIVGLARTKGLSATAVICDAAETLGVNSRTDLAAAETAFQAHARAEALDNGTTLLDPDSVHFAFDTMIGRDVVVEQNVVFGPGVTVETGAHIRAFSHLEGCHVSRGAVVGPYARLRPGAELSENVRVGNFVEVKNAILSEGVKVNHLSYVGNATVGVATNIGAGTITCNYDGLFKHHTTIGANAFIGSNTMLIAPVEIGRDAMTASGSVITENVPDGALALGRAKQQTKPGLAVRLFDKLRAAKERAKKN